MVNLGFFAILLLAAPGHTHENTPPENQNWEQFLDSVKTELESSTLTPEAKDHSQNKVYNYLQNLSPRELLLRSLRWHNLRSHDPTYGEHVTNLAVLLFVTELIELSTGPATTFLVNLNDWPLWVDASLQSIGYFISTPFILNASWLGPLAIAAEPFCAAGLATYKLSPRFRNGLTRSRKLFLRGGKAICDKTGLTFAFNKIYPLRSGLEHLEKLGWEILYDPISGLPIEMLFHSPTQDGEGRFIFIELGESEGVYVKSIMIRGIDANSFKSAIEPLNWSARQLLLRAYSANERREFQPREILIKNKRSFCSTFFESHLI